MTTRSGMCQTRGDRPQRAIRAHGRKPPKMCRSRSQSSSEEANMRKAAERKQIEVTFFRHRAGEKSPDM